MTVARATLVALALVLGLSACVDLNEGRAFRVVDGTVVRVVEQGQRSFPGTDTAPQPFQRLEVEIAEGLCVPLTTAIAVWLARR